MVNKKFSIQLSEYDEKRFGVNTAHAANVTLEMLPSVMEFCEENEVAFLVARCLSNELDAVHAMEKEGFSLMDTLMFFSWKFGEALNISRVPQIQARPVRSGEEERVREVAAGIFKGYPSHYQMDDRLDKEKSNQLFPDKAYEACLNRGENSEVFVIEIENEILGFNSLILKEQKYGVIDLSGIKKESQGQGLYWAFFMPITSWFASKGVQEMLTGTQVVNTRTMKVYSQLGYSPSHAVYTYHKWFD